MQLGSTLPTPDPDGLSPFQRAILNGQPYVPGMFAGWDPTKDPSWQPGPSLGGKGLPVLSPHALGMSVQPLGTPVSAPAQPLGSLPSGQSFGGYNLGPPPVAPVAPNLQPAMDQAGAARLLASGAPNSFQVQQNQDQGTGAGLKAQIAALPSVDPNAAQFHPTPFAPTALPQRVVLEAPTRPAPGHDPLSMGIAALAGLVDPRGAGNYNASPLQAGIDVANKQYQDRLQQFALTNQQLNQQYEAQRAQAELENAAQMHNLTAQQQANVALGQQQYANQEQRAGLTGQETAAEMTATGLGPLAQSQTGAAKANATLQQALENIAAQEKLYQDQIGLFGHEEGPYWGAARMLGSADIRGNAQTDAAGIRADAQTTVSAGHDATTIQKTNIQQQGATTRTGMQQSGANTRQDKQIKADGANAPTGAAAKDPNVQNAFKLYQGFASDLAKTERILQQGWKTAGGANVNDMGAFSRWMHSDPIWQHQADTANNAYTDYLTKATRANTPTPSTGGNTSPGGNASPTGQPNRQPAPGTTYDPRTHTFR